MDATASKRIKGGDENDKKREEEKGEKIYCSGNWGSIVGGAVYVF